MVEKQITTSKDLTGGSQLAAQAAGGQRESAAPGSRIVRPTDGVLLDDRHFKMEDVNALATALIEHTEGKLDRLRVTSDEVAAKIREQANRSRERIERALEMSDQLISRRLEESRERAREMEATAREEGHRVGHEKGLAEGDERGYREGLERGRKQGYEEALEESRLSLAEKLVEDTLGAVGMVESLASQLEVTANEVIRDARTDLLKLVMGIAERVIRAEVRQSPEIIAGVLEVAIDRIADRNRLTVEVHPADLDVASAHLDNLRVKLEESTVIHVERSEQVGRGGCRVRSGDAEVDLTIGTQLEILERRLFAGEAAPCIRVKPPKTPEPDDGDGRISQ